MPYGAIRTRKEKTPELALLEQAGKDLLNGYCRAKARNQKHLADETGMLQSTISRMANLPDVTISLEAALLIDVATEGQLPAERLCPARADLLEHFLAQRGATNQAKELATA